MMKSLTLKSCLMLICVSAAVTTVAGEKLLVSVFYETLCPYSIRFIKNQLYPVYRKLSKEIQLDLVPYGNGNTTMSPNGTIEFSCQHGPKECYANKLHVCALAHLETEAAIPFINCTISQKSPATAGPACAKALSLNCHNVNQCFHSQEGDLLLAAYGVRTKRETPPIQGVPWITFNNKYSEEDEDASTEDLLTVVCKYLKFKPSACAMENEIYTTEQPWHTVIVEWYRAALKINKQEE